MNSWVVSTSTALWCICLIVYLSCLILPEHTNAQWQASLKSEEAFVGPAHYRLLEETNSGWILRYNVLNPSMMIKIHYWTPICWILIGLVTYTLMPVTRRFHVIWTLFLALPAWILAICVFLHLTIYLRYAFHGVKATTLSDGTMNLVV